MILLRVRKCLFRRSKQTMGRFTNATTLPPSLKERRRLTAKVACDSVVAWRERYNTGESEDTGSRVKQDRQVVYEALKNVTSSDGSIRAAAKSNLKELSGIRVMAVHGRGTWWIELFATDYPVCLAQFTIQQDIEVPLRQISFLMLCFGRVVNFFFCYSLILNRFCLLGRMTLKLYVPTHWSAKDDDKFIGPLTPDEVSMPIYANEVIEPMGYRARRECETRLFTVSLIQFPRYALSAQPWFPKCAQ